MRKKKQKNNEEKNLTAWLPCEDYETEGYLGSVISIPNLEDKHAIKEKNMLKAILCRAVADACDKIGGKNKKKEIIAAREWIADENREEFSFLWICEILEIESLKIKEFISRNSI